jgi:hypothetical protein
MLDKRTPPTNMAQIPKRLQSEIAGRSHVVMSKSLSCSLYAYTRHKLPTSHGYSLAHWRCYIGSINTDAHLVVHLKVPEISSRAG